MKQASMFVLFVLPWRSTQRGCFRSRSWSLWKALDEEGCMGFGSMAFGPVLAGSPVLVHFFQLGGSVPVSVRFSFFKLGQFRFPVP
jgi:hypothetical protein